MTTTEKSRDAFRTISEAAAELDVPAHVLRFWESRFPQIAPLKRAGGRRFYRPSDLALLRGVKTLLYDQGLTIKGAKKFLKDHGVAEVVAIGEGGLVAAAPVEQAALPEAPARSAPPPSDGDGRSVQEVLRELEEAKAQLDAALAGEKRLL
jgi:DNA-binding transcriptional MerR regulator